MELQRGHGERTSETLPSDNGSWASSAHSKHRCNHKTGKGGMRTKDAKTVILCIVSWDRIRDPKIFPRHFALILVTDMAAAEENASNPLAAVNNVDLRWQFTSADAGDKHDVFVDGAYMLMPELKLKYELHYNFTDVTGSDENDFERVVVKPINFPYQTKLNEAWGLRAAVGMEWTVEFDNEDKGIGVGADTISPFDGFTFAHLPSGLTLIPLVQHFVSYSGDTDVNQTAVRLIALQPFGEGYWAKLDAKVPYDWENERWPASAEIQVGYNFGPSWAVYADDLVGIGSDRPYDAGVGFGLRFKF